MNQITEFKAHSQRVKMALKDMFHSLCGTAYIHQYFGLVMVLLSIILALIFPYQGILITSQSEGMTNYHRWLYDIFVIVNVFMGFVLFYILKRQRYNAQFRQKWRIYIEENAQFKLYRYQKAQEQGKKPLMHSRLGEYFLFLFLIFLFLIIYIFDIANRGWSPQFHCTRMVAYKCRYYWCALFGCNYFVFSFVCSS